MHTHSTPTSTAGMLYSLANELPIHSALARQAKRLAPRLNVRHSRALEDRAASLLAQLSTATDCADLAGHETEGCLDPDWDA